MGKMAIMQYSSLSASVFCITTACLLYVFLLNEKTDKSLPSYSILDLQSPSCPVFLLEKER